MPEFHDKVINTKIDKIVLLHPFHPAMSAKHFVSQLESVSGQYKDVCCYGLDLNQVQGAYKELGIQGLPAVIFFKNGDKIGELTGCIPPKHINTILQRHMPSKEESSPSKRTVSETAENPMPSTSVTVEPGLCEVCHLERVVRSLPSHPNDGIKHSKHEVDLDKLAENAERCDYCQFLIQTCRRDPKFLHKVTAGGGRVILLAKRDKGLAWLDLEGKLDSGRKSDLFKSRVLQMVPGSKSWDTSTHFSGRMVGNQPDFDLYRSWIQLCNDSHSPNCQEETMEATELGLRLIDVEDCCVVNAPSGARLHLRNSHPGVASPIHVLKSLISRKLPLMQWPSLHR